MTAGEWMREMGYRPLVDALAEIPPHEVPEEWPAALAELRPRAVAPPAAGRFLLFSLERAAWWARPGIGYTGRAEQAIRYTAPYAQRTAAESRIGWCPEMELTCAPDIVVPAELLDTAEWAEDPFVVLDRLAGEQVPGWTIPVRHIPQRCPWGTGGNTL